ncbi:MAG: hypothetical protein ACYC1L_18540 [Alphaproteobacteria bacterium]
MAGLLDFISGPDPRDNVGLLGSALTPEQQAAIRRRDLLNSGFDFAGGLLASSGPSPYPISTGQVLSSGLSAVNQGQRERLSDSYRQSLADQHRAGLLRQAAWDRMFGIGGAQPGGNPSQPPAQLVSAPGPTGMEANQPTLPNGEPTPGMEQMFGPDGMAPSALPRTASAPVPTAPEMPVPMSAQPPASAAGTPAIPAASNPMFANIPKEALPILGLMGPDQAGPILLRSMVKPPHERKIEKDAAGVPRYTDTGEPVYQGDTARPHAPPTRNRIENNVTIQEELQPDGTWKPIGKGPRWEGRAPKGDLSTAQQRLNDETDNARDELDGLGMSMADIMAATQPESATGRKNPDYNPYLKSLVSKSTRRKYGDDPDHQRYSQFVYGGNRGGQGANAAKSGAVMDLPMGSDGKIARDKLKVGATYPGPDGQNYRWDGMRFNPAQ